MQKIIPLTIINMMKYIILAGILILILFFGVSYQKNNHSPTPVDVVTTAQSVLTALKNKDYATLQTLTSSAGLSINEEPRLDLTKVDITKDQVSNIPANTQKYLFGYADGSGEPIEITQAEYFNKYMYNHDYLVAPEVVVNKTLGSGNSINTIATDVGTRTFVTFYFKGFNPEYGGMDWTTMYLVFDLENGKYTLRGIAKDNWTI